MKKKKKVGEGRGSATLRMSLFSHSSRSTHYPQPKRKSLALLTDYHQGENPHVKEQMRKKKRISPAATDTVTSVFMWLDGKTPKQKAG